LAGTIRNCYNTGVAYAYNGTVGGIVGIANVGTVEYCWTSGVYGSSGDELATWQAGGIAGDLPGSSFRIRYCVALSAGVYSSTGSVGRIVSHNNYSSPLTRNYARVTMDVRNSSGVVTITSLANGIHGEDVAFEDFGDDGGVWWKGSSGPDWTSYWEELPNTANESRPWKWDQNNGFPILWFEDYINTWY